MSDLDDSPAGEAKDEPQRSKGRKTLSREAWIAAAREAFETGGISSVKIDRLARLLRVTRGSFYFHFSSLQDLHDGLMDVWRASNCAPFLKLQDAKDIDGVQFFSDIVHVWVDENPFSPRLDLAVREWSRRDAAVAREIKDIDTLRIDLLVRAFLAMGYSDDESTVRARLTYFHQIGQYALSFEEDQDIRKRYQPIFGDVLLGPLVEQPEHLRVL